MSSCITTPATSDWMTRPGTISHAMMMPDGAHVYLDAVVVDKIRAKIEPAYFVIRECLKPNDRPIVLTQPSPDLRLNQTVDVEGTLTTLPNGHRAVVSTTVWGYLDRNGDLMEHEILKGFMQAIPWPNKTDLTVSASASEAEITASSKEPNPDPDDEPVYCADVCDITEPQDTSGGIGIQANKDYVSQLPGLPAGLMVELRSKKIQAVDSETIGEVTYDYVDIADDPPGTAWIRAYYTGNATTADRVGWVLGQIRYVNEVAVICVDTGPGYEEQAGIGRMTTLSPGTIAYALSLPDGEAVSLTGKVVTANEADFPGALYVQEPPGGTPQRFGGIRVWCGGATIDRGTLVNVAGTMGTGGDDQDGERAIAAGTVESAGQGTLPKPLGMANNALGGGLFGTYTIGFADPEAFGHSVYNKGMLARIWGRVTSVDSENKCFYVDDGSTYPDAEGNLHRGSVKVSWDWPESGKADITPPEQGWYVVVTGVSGSDTDDDGDTYYPVLRARDLNDLHVADPVQPTVTIDQAMAQSDPTNSTPIAFTAVFSVPVTDFDDAGAVEIGGTAGGTKTVTITQTDTEGKVYRVAVSGMTSGTVIASIPSGVAVSESGVWNSASTSTDNVVLYDEDIPTIAACTVMPVLSSGQVTITYTGADDAGGSGLFAVGLYQVESGQYTLVDARTGSTNTFALTYTGNGTVNNLVLIAFDNAGNHSVDNSVPPFIIDQTAPSQPANVIMAHVLPTSRSIHATWDACTDANGIQNYSYQFWYVDSSGQYGLCSVLTTTDTQATLDLGGYLPTDTKTYGIRVWARDSAGNASDYTDSNGLQCQKAQVGYLYALAAQVWPNDTYPDGFRGMIHGRLTNTASTYSTIMQYLQLTSIPTNLDDYDVLVISCPALGQSPTTDEMTRISTWARKWHHRLILVGDASSYHPTGQPVGYYNQRLNDIASNVYSGIPAFKTSSGSIPSPYNIGTCYYFSSYHSWLLTSVTGLDYASPGWFDSSVSTWIARVDATYKWIAETDLPNGGLCLGIHDCNVFDTYNTTASHAYFTRNICTRFE